MPHVCVRVCVCVCVCLSVDQVFLLIPGLSVLRECVIKTRLPYFYRPQTSLDKVIFGAR